MYGFDVSCVYCVCFCFVYLLGCDERQELGADCGAASRGAAYRQMTSVTLDLSHTKEGYYHPL